jgi:hypothetical protein
MNTKNTCPWLLSAALILIGLTAHAQSGRKVEVLKSAEGFPGGQILEVFNRIPFIKTPDGFEVKGSYHVNANPMLPAHRGIVNWDFEEKFSNAPLYRITLLTNDFSFMAQKSLLGEETAHFHFPDFYTDTLALSWFTHNGVQLAQGVDRRHSSLSDTFFVLNPRGRAFFKPVSQEEYLHFLLLLLQDRMDQRKKHLSQHYASGGRPPEGIDPSNARAMAIVARNLRADTLWINYYQQRMNEYKTLLATMSAEQKNQRAYAITPKVMVVENDKKGNLKEAFQGGFPFELLRNKDDAATIIPLYEFNPSFFDPHLPPAAVQVMVFRDINGTTRPKEFDRKIREQFFPGIDFKAFASLMYK